jgi:hypothetical protein
MKLLETIENYAAKIVGPARKIYCTSLEPEKSTKELRNTLEGLATEFVEMQKNAENADSRHLARAGIDRCTAMIRRLSAHMIAGFGADVFNILEKEIKADGHHRQEGTSELVSKNVHVIRMLRKGLKVI